MRPRRRLILLVCVPAAGVLAACGTEGIKLDKADGDNAQIKRGALLFQQRCGGCHTLTAAGTQGSPNELKYRERVDGPNFDQRPEQADQILYAIENGGFSGAIMPQNIVVGQDARDVAAFLAKYAGRDATSPPAPKAPRQEQPQGGEGPPGRGAGTEP
jgi:mono/diheme cytochrome c family protein